ncbi:hypothetical protein ACP275_08G080700 [Erythranthe tilingii]
MNCTIDLKSVLMILQIVLSISFWCLSLIFFLSTLGFPVTVFDDGLLGMLCELKKCENPQFLTEEIIVYIVHLIYHGSGDFFIPFFSLNMQLGFWVLQRDLKHQS